MIHNMGKPATLVVVLIIVFIVCRSLTDARKQKSPGDKRSSTELVIALSFLPAQSSAGCSVGIVVHVHK